ncbi:hypothetical protein SAMN05216339_10343 [Nitrosomonas eutropha]|uniref:Uncharacterized protein n=1 Tax=Nitrosomonas eutropha TaxID=916 RepID=A0A1I7GLQ8_9PROT|nr:hypothetical protein SAMN05216339_10343 [Nitrosomonas eutropha]
MFIPAILAILAILPLATIKNNSRGGIYALMYYPFGVNLILLYFTFISFKGLLFCAKRVFYIVLRAKLLKLLKLK